MDIYNWKTIQEIDGAFRNYRKDPQEVSISSASQTRLPEIYNGENWVTTGPSAGSLIKFQKATRQFI